MDPTSRFFTKLKKLAVTLESETAKLQHRFENRNNDGDSESAAKAMRAYHELNCDIGDLKGQIREQLAQQKAQENEVSNFIKACRVMKQRVTEDIQAVREHWEKYGYQAPQDTKARGQESEAEEAADENETESAAAVAGGEMGEGEDGGNNSSSPLTAGLPPSFDVLRTPKLSDFGLSEMHLKRALAGGVWCSEVPPMPEMSLPQPSLNMPAPPPMPITPKCALRMDEAELQTPQMHDFGISEHTVCLNNDFTMDLHLKNAEKPQRKPQDAPVPPLNSLMKENSLQSPEPPVFCTPGFKIKKTNGHCSPPAQANDDPQSPGCPGNLPTTPEVPAFQTPYVNRLVSAKKGARQPEHISKQPDDGDDDGGDDDDDRHTFELPTPPRSRAAGSKRTWEYNVPDISIGGLEVRQMPEMPNLESVLGNSLQSRSAKMQKKTSKHEKELTVSSLELDGATQEFSLGTPRLRVGYQEPSTPEMPDLSSVTQDICKLVSQAQSKKTAMPAVPPHVSPLRGADSLSVVSESEFLSLPSYLRQMTLHSLNQAVHSINKFTAERPGEKTEFQMEDLRGITNAGAKTPVYILCLTELKRLEHVGGARSTSVYKLSTRS